MTGSDRCKVKMAESIENGKHDGGEDNRKIKRSI